MSKEPQSDLETEQLRQRNRELAILNSIAEVIQKLDRMEATGWTTSWIKSSAGYWAVVPPSMTSSEPVTNDDSSEAR